MGIPKILLHQEAERRQWNELKPHKMTQEEVDKWSSGLLEDKVGVLEGIPRGEYLEVATLQASEFNTQSFHTYIKNLQEAGLNIGNGDSIYGYRMPLPQNGQAYRYLRIFRKY